MEIREAEEVTGVSRQNIRFYEKQGLELIAEIKDWPKGITRYEFVRYIK